MKYSFYRCNWNNCLGGITIYSVKQGSKNLHFCPFCCRTSNRFYLGGLRKNESLNDAVKRLLNYNGSASVYRGHYPFLVSLPSGNEKI